MNSPTLVVHLVHRIVVGGLENGIVNLVNAPRSGQRHAIICMTSGDGSRVRIGPGVPVFELGKSTGHDVRTFARLVRLLRRLRPSVVHTRNWATIDGVLAARLARVPTVVHGEHGRNALDMDGRNVRHNCVRRLLSPMVDRFVTVSADLRQWLVQQVGIRPDKVVTIHNGVDTDRYVPGDARRVRSELYLRPEQAVVGTVGRLDPVKDQAGLIRAFAGLTREDSDTALVIVGDGPCRNELLALATSLGLADQVRFVGTRHDVPELLRVFDIFVLPSIAEGLSNAILEAMATGLPVIATRVGGNSELVDDEVTGRLVPRHSPNALEGSLRTYLSDPVLRVTHGRRGRQRALRRFGLDAMRDAYADLYAALGNRRQRRYPARSRPSENATSR